MLGKSHHATDVSSPVLHYTNAVQRNDLQTLAATTLSDQNTSDPRHISLLGLQHPRTSEGRDRRPNLRIEIPPMPPPPMIHTGGYDSDGSNLIGIALGSPRLVHRRNGARQAEQQQQQQNKRHASRYHPALEKPHRTPLQRKPSKWRKIGGLFKTKYSAMESAPNQVRNHKPPGSGGEPDSGVDDKGNCFGGGGGGKLKSCLEAKRRLNAENSKPNQAQVSSESQATDPAPMLEVDIPDSQMERYSVMFGGLFGQGKPGLLARRSKTMDDVTASRTNASPEPQRATSPTRSRSRSRTPSFSLFPTMQVSKASKVLGTSNIPRGPSPLARSQTLPTGQEQECLLNGHSPLPSPMSFKSRLSGVSSTMASNGPGKRVDINIGKDTVMEDTTNPFATHDNEKTPKPLSINTENNPQFPHSRNHSHSTTSSPVLSPLDATRHKINSLLSPTTDPSSTTLNGDDNNQNQNQDEHDNKDQAQSHDRNQDQDPDPEPPKIEISVARSVSVSKSKKKQVLVPIGPRTGPDRLTPDSLGVGERKGKTPQVMDGYFGHRPGTSQDVRIETLG